MDQQRSTKKKGPPCQRPVSRNGRPFMNSLSRPPMAVIPHPVSAPIRVSHRSGNPSIPPIWRWRNMTRRPVPEERLARSH